MMHFACDIHQSEIFAPALAKISLASGKAKAMPNFSSPRKAAARRRFYHLSRPAAAYHVSNGDSALDASIK